MKVTLLIGLFLILSLSSNGQCLPIADNMTLLDNWDNDDLYPSGNPEQHYSDVWGYVDGDGNEYGILGGRDSIFIIDVTDPENIFLVESLYQGDTSLWRDFKVYGDYLYSITDGGQSVNKGVVIYYLSNLPVSASKVNMLNSEFLRCHNIYIDIPNAKLYAVGMTISTDICVYDLSVDPANPGLWGCYDLDTIETTTLGLYIHDIFVKDNIAYSCHGRSGYFVWDFSDKNNISVLGSIDGNLFDNRYVHSSWNSEDDNHAIIASEVNGDPKLFWIDQSDFSNMSILSVYKDPICDDPENIDRKRPHNPYIVGDKIYTSHYHDGIHVINIDFANDTLERIGHYDTYPDNTDYSAAFPGNWGAYPYLPSGIILASDRKYGLFTLRFDGELSYIFTGPGLNFEDPENWQEGIVPPVEYEGKIIITKPCEISPETTLDNEAEIIVNTGATFTVKGS